MANVLQNNSNLLKRFAYMSTVTYYNIFSSIFLDTPHQNINLTGFFLYHLLLGTTDHEKSKLFLTHM